MNDDIEKAIMILNKGGIIIFPTDTAYGIGCRIDKEEAILRLFRIRKRPKDMPTPVLFDSIERVKEYVLPFDLKVERLMKKYWPGALTLILDCNRAKVPFLVRGGGKTLGVRIPDHELPIKLIKGADAPIIGTSANFHGEQTPYSFEDLDKNLIQKVDFILHGKSKFKKTSTVIDCSVNPWKILRGGAVDIKINL